MSPHEHDFGENVAKGTSGMHNYCRNPNGNAGGIWCYTTDPSTPWEHCDALMDNVHLPFKKNVHCQNDGRISSLNSGVSTVSACNTLCLNT